MERYIGPVPPAWGPVALKMFHADDLIPEDPEPEYREGEPVSGPLNELINGQERREADRSQMSHPLETLFDTQREISQDEILLLADLLRKIFRYEPDERLKPIDALKHPWFDYGHNNQQGIEANKAATTTSDQNSQQTIEQTPQDISSGVQEIVQATSKHIQAVSNNDEHNNNTEPSRLYWGFLVFIIVTRRGSEEQWGLDI